MSYQRIYRPRLFVSWPLYQFSVGQLKKTLWTESFLLDDSNVAGYNHSADSLYKMIQLDPARYSMFKLDQATSGKWLYLYYHLSDNTNEYAGLLHPDDIDKITQGFDYFMILGHNLKSCGLCYSISAGNANLTSFRNLQNGGMINAAEVSSKATPEYNGFSWSEINGGSAGHGDPAIKIAIGNHNYESPASDTLAIGSLLWGKSFTFPYNADIEQSTSFKYGIKSKESATGRSVSVKNWAQRNKWATNPFTLSQDNIGNYAIDAYQMSGRRVWNCKFSFLAPENVVGQNLNTNSIGWSNTWTNADSVSTTYSGYEVDGNNESLYDLLSPADTDFYSIVVNRTLGGALPMVLQLDAVDGGNPDSFAIVKMDPNYEIRHVGKDLYEVELGLIEQI